jgi:hypothetical protein
MRGEKDARVVFQNSIAAYSYGRLFTSVERPTASLRCVKAAPYKCSPPFTEAECEIRWGTGIDATS